MSKDINYNDKISKRKYRLAQNKLPIYPEESLSSSRSSTPSQSFSEYGHCTSIPLIISKMKMKAMHQKLNDSKSKPSKAKEKQSNEKSIKNRNENDENINKIHMKRYEYKKLNDILQMFPLPTSNQLVNLYGVIVSYNNDSGIMTIKDETFERFRLYPNYNNINNNVNVKKRITTTIEPISKDDNVSVKSESYYEYETGDIIRIHRLTLNSNLIHRNRLPRNIVIFKSFDNKDIFNPITLAENPTFEPYDRKRLEELSRWQIENLLHAPKPRSLSSFNQYEIIDAAFLVWNIRNCDKKTIVCCWTPSYELVANHPCYISVSLNSIVAKMTEENDNHHSFSRRLINRIYHKKQLIYLNVFGQHRSKVIDLKCCETIVVFEIVIKPDNFYPGYYSYMLHDKTTYGQSLRRTHPNSLIAREMHEKMTEYVQNPPEILEMNRHDLDHLYENDKYALQ